MMIKNRRGIALFKSEYPPQGGIQAGIWRIFLLVLFSMPLLAHTSLSAMNAPNEAPVAKCKNITIHLDLYGMASIMAEDVDDGSYDNDGNFVLFVDIENFSCDDVGDNQVRLLILDDQDEVDLCYATVTVVDDIMPTLDAESLPDVFADCEVAAEDLVTPTASDNCFGTIEGVPDVDFPITEQGTTMITWTFTDAGGNTLTQTQNVTISEDIAPVPDQAMLPDIIAQCMVEEADLEAPTATDNCVGTVTGTTDAVFPISEQGAAVITWTYDDGHGNTSTQTQNVLIDDSTPPVPDVETLDQITAQCVVEQTDVVPPTATDNCGGEVTVSTDAAFPIDQQGPTVITWTFTDQYGNSSSQTQQVVIEDTTGPTPNVETLDEITAQCLVEATDVTPPTATDNCGGAVTVTTDTSFPIDQQGPSVITWTFTDQYGNASNQTQQVVIEDTTGPTAVLETLPDITAQCMVEEADVTPPAATDNCGGEVTVTTDAVFPIDQQGPTTITWIFTDQYGNTSSQTQQVVIEDTTAPTPVLATLPDMTAQCMLDEADVTPPAATDNCGGEVMVTTDAVFPIDQQGPTVINWIYTDQYGNTSMQSQNVIIDDTMAPTPDAETLDELVAQCMLELEDITPPTATDNCGGEVTVTPDAVFPIDQQGPAVITWTFTDLNGNSSTQTQQVLIEDTTGPTPTMETLDDITAQCVVEATDVATPMATDNCGGAVSVTSDASFPIYATSLITWTYHDQYGNTTEQTQNVVIEDTTAPVATAPSLPDVLDECSVSYEDLIPPTATDNCGGMVTVTTDAVFPVTAQGTSQITWTFSDQSGNSSTQTQNIIIADVTDPVPNAASLPDITAICELAEGAVTPPTASDNCMGTITGVPDPALPINTVGTHQITWSFTDAGGNTVVQTQNVTIEESPLANVSLDDLAVTYNGTSYELTVTGLPEGASVSYENNQQVNAGTYPVTAVVDPGVESCPTLELTATLTIEKAPQTITFDEIPIKHLEEDDDFSLNATASSGLEVSYSYTYEAETAPATVSPTGEVVLISSGVVEITASQPGNDNYLPAEPVTQILTIESSDASIHELTINETTYVDPPQEIHYEMACDENMQQVTVSFTKEVGATANVDQSFVIVTSGAGTFVQTITLTSQDGTQTQSYDLIIDKPFNYLSYSNLVIEKFNNVLLVSNNPDTNGGYRFVSYKWYKNGSVIGTDQYYSAGENANNTLDASAVYVVEMTDAAGNIYRTCEFAVSYVSTAYTMDVYPNPAPAGTSLEVETSFTPEMLSDMTITVSSLYGMPVLKTISNKNSNQLILPSSLPAGTYVVTSRAGELVLTRKIIVE
ncbi:putative secreted protein (Por secretion system target) [Mangrovibacterium marinum]|uniref:Putative secreted protein (Por secretion system target) n=1 Tax=Mangrovibacterium marinum TaxID=1639118 RepID=A0A2T5C031_9BACT|nr:T9SS type A sorting domain-containing protein [Mangrovibacterium marinum]PTN07904.1 putative secreted protein (Por secretion system target) [Mangrovibacterium marinum]